MSFESYFLKKTKLMKTLATLLLAVLPLLSFTQSNRYVIYEDYRFGFIDGEGEEVIEPRFRNVGYFSQGLAPAREEAYWGFIDTLGRWAIRPQYDYAEEFNHGFAEVWRQDTSIVISRDGKEWARSKHVFRKLIDKYHVIPQDSQICILMNEDCRLTLPKDVYPVGLMGHYIKLRKTGSWPWKYGLIDTTGAVIIPFGHYDNLHPFFNGEALASRFDSSSSSNEYFFVNSGGKAVRRLDFPNLSKFGINYSQDGRLFTVNYQDKENRRHENLMNSDGKLLLDTDTLIDIYPLGYGLAAIKNRRSGEWLLANEHGLCCTETPITRLPMTAGPWRGGYLYGQEAGQWVRFDTNGARQELPGLAVLDTIQSARLYVFRGGNLATFGVEQKGRGAKRGLLHVTQGMILPPAYDAIIPMVNFGEPTFLPGGLVVAVIKGEEVQYVRIQEEGNRAKPITSSFPVEVATVIWQKRVLSKKELIPYDTDSPAPMTYQKRKPLKMPWWLRLFTRKARFFRPNLLTIPFMKQYEGRRLFLLNDSPDTLVLSAYNMGQLSIYLEAQDAQGEWRRIDHCRHCDVYSNAIQWLPPGHYLVFGVPKMAGAMRTKLRYVATYWTPEEARETIFVERADGQRYRHKYPLDVIEGKKLYSRTFTGGVNPAQFHREQYRRREPPFIQDWMPGR